MKSPLLLLSMMKYVATIAFVSLLWLFSLVLSFRLSKNEILVNIRSKYWKYNFRYYDANNFPLSTSYETVSLTRELNYLKQGEKLSKWSSSVSYACQISSIDLYQITRQSFQSTTYFDDLLSSMDPNRKQNQLINGYILSSILIVLLGMIVIPMFDRTNNTRNVVGLLSLLYPFIGAILCFSVPDLFFMVIKNVKYRWNPRLRSLEQERIVYHEAGHILVGYLCGVAVHSYAITDDITSHAAVDIDSELFRATLNDEDRTIVTSNATKMMISQPTLTIGNLLIVAMGGVVAETLRFGTSEGGSQDLIVAQTLLNIVKCTSNEKIGYLRWSVGKAMTLLRLHRNALDELVVAIQNGKDIRYCYQVIEDAVD